MALEPKGSYRAKDGRMMYRLPSGVDIPWEQTIFAVRSRRYQGRMRIAKAGILQCRNRRQPRNGHRIPTA